MSGSVGAAKYTAEQRDAVGAAATSGLTAPEVARLASAGQLEHDGARLDPFEIPPSSVRHYRRQHARRAAAATDATAAPRDEVENLRQRYRKLAKDQLSKLEKAAAAGQDVNLEKMRQVGRVILELSRLPGPLDPRPPSPNTRDANGKRGVAARGGLAAGALLQAHREGARAPEPAPSPAAPEPPAEPEPVEPDRDREMEAFVIGRLREHGLDPDAVPAAPQAAQDARPHGTPANDRDDVPYHRMPAEDTSAIDGLEPHRRGRMRGAGW